MVIYWKNIATNDYLYKRRTNPQVIALVDMKLVSGWGIC